MSGTQSYQPATGHAQSVIKRHVFYLSGFDPRGAAFYHRLYQEESLKQAPLLHAEIKVGSRSRQEKYVNHWLVQSNFHHLESPQPVETNYFFLNWDDIVREHWEPNVYKLIYTSGMNYWRYYRCGAFAKIKQAYQRPFLSALYPWISLIVLACISLILGYVAAKLVGFFMPALLSFLVAVMVLTASFSAGIKLVHHWGVFWLLRIYNFVAEQGFNNSDQLRPRIDYFTDFIQKMTYAHPADEILLIGHSVGSILAIDLMANYAIKNPESAHQLKLVTLGQCIPLLGGMPQATSFHQHLAFIENQQSILWVDYLARADSLGFLREDSLSNRTKPQPSIQIVRFFNMFSALKYKKIQRNKLKLHFQYMMATDTLGDYDYFSLTAGFKKLTINI